MRNPFARLRKPPEPPRLYLDEAGPEDLATRLRTLTHEALTHAHAKRLVDAKAGAVERQLISESPMFGSPIVPAGDLNPAADKARPANMWGGQKYPGAYKFNRPFDFVVPQAPDRRPRLPVTIEDLRQIADSYDIVRDCINHIKREVKQTAIEFVPTDEQDDSEETKAAIERVQEFFSVAGGFGGYEEEPQDFVDELVEDLLTTGAGCYWITKTLAGDPLQIVCIDGATIRPRVTAFGWPDPSDYRYEQWIYGVQVGMFYADEMRFRGIYRISNSPYYRTPLEWLLMQIHLGVRYDKWNLDWLTDGNSPDTWLEAPETWTSEQFYEYVDYLDAMMRDMKARQQAKISPPGVVPHPSASTHRDSQFLEGQLWIMQRICAMFGVHPAALGFDGSQFAVTQSNSMSQTSAFGVGVVLAYVIATYNYIITHVLKEPTVKACDGTVVEPDPAAKATQYTTLVAGGIFTPNEARQSGYALEPVEGGDTILVQTTLRPLEQALEPPAPPPVPGAPPQPGGKSDDGQRPDPAERIIREYLGLDGPEYQGHDAGHDHDDPALELARIEPSTVLPAAGD